MIRQARKYLVGAMSGAGLIVAAIAVFVVLVSTQVFGNFPIPGLLGGGGDTGVSGAKEAAAPVAAGSGGGAAAGQDGAKAAGTAGKGGGAGKGGSGSGNGGGTANLG